MVGSSIGISAGAPLDAELEGRLSLRQGLDQVQPQKIQVPAILEGRKGGDGAHRELARDIAAQERRHAPVADVQRVRDRLPADRQRLQQFVQPEFERVEAREEEGERVGGGLEVDVVGGVTHEERRGVQQDEVLRPANASGDPHHLDGHAAAVAGRVGLRRLRAVGEADPGRIARGAREQARCEVPRQAVQHPEFGLHAAVRLGMGVAVRRSPCGGHADPALNARDDRLDRGGLGGRARFERRPACRSVGDQHRNRDVACHRCPSEPPPVPGVS
jgi:hypothetical protein